MAHPVAAAGKIERVSFSLEALKEHRLFRISVWSHIRTAHWLVVLSVSLIYACLIPFLFLDLAITIYQAVCFPIYEVPKVRREDYLIFDRGKLAYLNAVEKVGCVYCSYANGLLAYVAEIAARTEQRFCTIKHRSIPIQTPSRYRHFLPYGDPRAYRSKSEAVCRAYGDLAGRGK